MSTARGPRVTAPLRTMALWCPDWPVMAALAEHPAETPVAVLDNNVVVACSPQARADGVRRGMRRRDAQARCPKLVLAPHRPDADARRFDDVLEAVEELSPGVAPLRPGLCALRVPARFYGGEAEAAAVIAERIVSLGVWDVRLGVADGLFAAEQAARRAAPQDVVVVPGGASGEFLADLPVECLDDAELVDLLRRLGLTTLGGFASLDHADVHTRFGAHGARLHRLAAGGDPHPISRRRPPAELTLAVSMEPPLDSVETIAFSVRATAERFVAGLADHGLVCTGVRIEAEVDGVVGSQRSWAHPRWFASADLVDRVRWQLTPDPRGTRGGPTGAVGAVRFVPEVVEPLGDHADTLFGTGVDERVERGIARVQGLVGHDAVVAPTVQGGRSPVARRASRTWGERAEGLRPASRPWPGQIPAPAPATVYRSPRSAAVVGGEGQVVRVDGRGALSCEPQRFRAGDSGDWLQVAAWAGPWPVDELWWDEAAARRVARFQVVGADGSAWLMVVENGQWFTEARYD